MGVSDAASVGRDMVPMATTWAELEGIYRLRSFLRFVLQKSAPEARQKTRAIRVGNGGKLG